jgi:hypothetical protein
MDGFSFCGYGYTDYDGFGTRRIEIVKNRNCWDDQSDVFKEILVFHEIGHAILGRPHIWNSLPDGSEVSLMCGDQFCNPFGVYNRYQEYKRDYYIDELLGVHEGIPDWAYAKNEIIPFSTEIFESKNWNKGNGANYFINVVANDNGNTTIDANINTPITVPARKGIEYKLVDNKECDNYRFLADAAFKNVRGFLSPYIEIEAFRSENSNEIIHFDRSYFNTPMKGTGTRMDVTVELPCIAEEMDRLRCYVAFPEGYEGEISFSNFRLERAR